MTTDRPSLGFGMPLGAGTQEQQRGHQQAPAAEEAERFASLLDGGPARPGGAERPASAAVSPGLPHAGDAMLRMMGAVPRADERPAPSVGGLLEELASRLLVADPVHGQGREVRVAVKEQIFPGLEIRIREEAGRLVVELSSPSPSDLALLRADAPAFGRRLGEKLGREVEIRLKRRTEAGETDADDDAGAAPAPEAPARA